MTQTSIDDLNTITGNAHPDTSHLAAARVLPRTGTQRRRVYEAIVAAGDRGMTDDEIAAGLSMSPNSVRPRRVELADDGFIVKNGHVRANLYGNPCTVWVAA